MKSKIAMLGMILSLITVSCNKDRNDDTTNDFTSEEASINTKIDIENDDVSKIVEEQLKTTDGISGKAAVIPFLPSCGIVTRVPATGVPTAGATITKTITFSSTGCILPNGNVLKGKIIISFPYEPNATSHTITVTFINFYHNLRKIEGTKTFTRTIKEATVAVPAHPVIAMNMDLTITLPDGRILKREGFRTSEIIVGYDTPDWKDNEYSVTGSWTTTFPNANAHTSTISSPLLVKFACLPTNNAISKGVITFSRNNRTATLDYGNGDCDNLAVFTINGVAYDIILGK
jgi:hypothetical protein